MEIWIVTYSCNYAIHCKNSLSSREAHHCNNKLITSKMVDGPGKLA